MPHIDDETLALRALGEHVTPDVAEHLATCDECRTELTALERVTHAGRYADRDLVAPPAAVWDRIADELGLEGLVDDGGVVVGGAVVDGGAVVGATAVVDDGAVVDGGAAPVAGPAAAPVAGRAAAPDAGRAAASRADAPSSAGGASVTPLPQVESRWRRRVVWVAAASFIAGVGGTALVQGVLDRPAEAPVVASAELDPLPGWEGAGTATVHEVDGRQVLTVELGQSDEAGYREVWLLDPEVQRLISLGILRGDEGEFELPPGLDLGEFPIVDISDEPYDGDPSHSGESIARGQLA
ncbi:anti-sigma factor [Georgenia faecalis]|uniref:Anti-sigma factor n=1 Tax=Georgenia faecalis TaxID=2483799 RepID=A0ABV9D4Z5_9MICO|nr:anti-sigma factor [Georgenia faecalis]